MKSLLNIKKKVELCKSCKLYKYRQKISFGDGMNMTPFMIIGDYPEKVDSRYGEVFITEQGVLLVQALHMVDLKKEYVYKTNLVKCYPGKNIPTNKEYEACLKYLNLQIMFVNPKILILFGERTANFILKNNLTINELMETKFIYRHIPTYVVHHPRKVLKGIISVECWRVNLIKALKNYKFKVK